MKLKIKRDYCTVVIRRFKEGSINDVHNVVWNAVSHNVFNNTMDIIGENVEDNVWDNVGFHVFYYVSKPQVSDKELSRVYDKVTV